MVNQLEEIREVRRWGNSGGVLLPREWLGKQIKVILIDRTEEIKKEVLEILSPYFNDLQGIYLIGSYARNEQEKDSDIDIIAISNKTKKVISSGKYNIQIYTLEGIKNTLKYYPISIYPSLIEAKVIMNSSLLEELKSLKVNRDNFKEYLKDCLRILNINKLIMKKNEGVETLKDNHVIYSIFLRLRGVFLIKSILDSKVYSKNEFIYWIKSNVNISDEEFINAYEIYKSIRDNKKVNKHASIETSKCLLDLLEKEIKKHDKKKKEA